MSSALDRLGGFFTRWTQRLLPDPMVLACLLSLAVMVLALIHASAGAPPEGAAIADRSLPTRIVDVIEIWFRGLWAESFLRFALQMCLILLTGYGLAQSPPAVAFLRWAASQVRSNRAAVLSVTAVSCMGCWINWGFGLIAAGLFAAEIRREFARRRRPCQYALVVAGAYAGMMIWHGGLSGSAPLEAAGKGVTIQRRTGAGVTAVTLEPINIRRTLVSPGNLALSVLLIGGIPVLFRAMARCDEDLHDAHVFADVPRPGGPAAHASTSVATTRTATIPIPADQATPGEGPAARIGRARTLSLVVALVILSAMARLLATQGVAAVNLNFVIAAFLSLGLLLHRNLLEYVAAVAQGGAAVTGIILQFPLYSGIQSVMGESGLGLAVSQTAVHASSWLSSHAGVGADITFPIATFLSAGLVNLFVPSGGGQWIVQGPLMCGAADALGLPVEQAVMAIAYGDQWTNMIQPFWAIPIMGLTGVNVREFMGYCALLCLLAGPVFGIAVVLL